MGDVTPIRSGIISKRINELPIINEVDDMLREGIAATDIATYVQQTFEFLTDVSMEKLASSLRRRRKKLSDTLPEPQDWPAIENGDGFDGPRTPGLLAGQQYRKASRGIDLMLEAESLYLAQRDRLDRLMRMEQDSGEPYEEMPKEFGRAESLLTTHAKLQEQFGPAVDRMRMSLEIQGGSATGLGQRIAAVMDDPESRHKVLNMFRRLTQAASLPAVIDAEAEPAGGS